jgi:hypothetical protein
MNPQESQVLQDFLNQLAQAKGIAKDPQADDLIAKAVAQQPDAAYLLVQRSLLLDQALTNSKAQIAQLQTELQAARAAGSNTFVDANYAWGRPSGDALRSMPSAPSAPSVSPQAMQSPQNPAPAASPSFLSGGAGSILGNVATTAAGVAAGAFLFQGIGSLMGGHHGSGFLGQTGQASGPTENITTVNNYYSGDTAPAEDADDDIFGADNSGIDDSDSSLV